MRTHNIDSSLTSHRLLSDLETGAVTIAGNVTNAFAMHTNCFVLNQ